MSAIDSYALQNPWTVDSFLSCAYVEHSVAVISQDVWAKTSSRSGFQESAETPSYMDSLRAPSLVKHYIILISGFGLLKVAYPGSRHCQILLEAATELASGL